MNSSFRIILTLALQLSAAGALVACGGDEKGDDKSTDEGPAAGGSSGGLTLAFNPMYSAYEPEHTYQVPVIVDTLPPDVEWSAEPADAVRIEANAQGAALLTMQKSGEVTIKAKTKDGKSGSAKLTIQAATPDEYKLGSDRYNSMQAAIRSSDAGAIGFGIDPSASCTNCHGDTSALEVQHSPQQTAGYSAAELIKIFTEATKPEGIPQRTTLPAMIWNQFHKWQMSDAEKQAIVVYLRSLPPKPTNANIDFLGAARRLLPEGGIRFNFDGGIRRRGDGGSSTTTPDAGSSSTTTVTPSNMDAGI